MTEEREREKCSKKQISNKRKKRCTSKYWAQIIKPNCKMYSFIILQVYYKYYCCLFHFVQNWLYKYKSDFKTLLVIKKNKEESYCTECTATQNLGMAAMTLSYILQDPS
jgi:hypothetical protein